MEYDANDYSQDFPYVQGVSQCHNIPLELWLLYQLGDWAMPS
ncbi:Putative outer membrane lipoprotein YmcA [Vibrio vulnificus]|nr:Putative outer membrane lipoprotein YmcA [Vibrio vulnificus]